MESLRVLFFTLNGSITPGLKDAFTKSNMSVREVRSISDVEKELTKEQYHVLVQRADTVRDIPVKLLQFMKVTYPALPTIISVKDGKIEDVVVLVKAGADDFVVAPHFDENIIRVIQRNVKSGIQGSGGVGRRNPVQINSQEVTLIGKSPAIEDVRSAIDLVADSETPVLITGESGTGKEVAARLIHMRSRRAERPFVAINCAALPRDVIENELFGHDKGAFTGAVEKKSGCFELANSGTLFFDEIAEMSPDTQAKLLRAIEQKAFRRLGGKEEINVDVRLVAATNKNIAVALKSGEFRQDLYYRFSVIEIYMPPLRERREDIPLLVDHFFSLFKQRYGRMKQTIANDAMKFLVEYNWPGNVRELRNVLERVVVTGSNGSIRAEHLSARILKNESGNGYIVNIPIGTSSEEAERQLILQTLTYLKNNKSKAAKMLGLSRKTLHNKLNKMAARNKAGLQHEEL
ncbi:MAG: sigma-54-dependent Fis family transcriptional regulator [Bacteroidota bacterium]|nr:sigma-54-dependent Fis family transcriptional regulator [Bacteroidota bacterium]